jgi:hypothetical protein
VNRYYKSEENQPGVDQISFHFFETFDSRGGPYCLYILIKHKFIGITWFLVQASG